MFEVDLRFSWPGSWPLVEWENILEIRLSLSIVELTCQYKY